MDDSPVAEDERRRRRPALRRLLRPGEHDSGVSAPANPPLHPRRGSNPCPTPFSPIQPRKVRVDENCLLGTGSFGKVFRGLNEATGELIAVKEIDFSAGGQELKEQLQMLAREITIMKKLTHPNIVRYLGANREDHTLRIYMEYVPGGSLGALVKRFGKLPEETCKMYLTQMLHGLAYLHNQKVAHRDIKGDNVLLEVSGQVKLADFGTSREVENAFIMTRMRTVVGTPWFMAPEVIKGEGYDFEADVWSVGCTAIELLTAKPPWSHFATAHAAMFHIASCNEAPPFPPDISEAAKEFLAMCLYPDPDQRANVQELLASAFCGTHGSEISDIDSDSEMLEQPAPTAWLGPGPPVAFLATDPEAPKRPQKEEEGRAATPPERPSSEASSATGRSDLQYLKELHELRQQGVITSEEFEAKKRQILWGSPGSAAPPAGPQRPGAAPPTLARITTYSLT